MWYSLNKILWACRELSGKRKSFSWSCCWWFVQQLHKLLSFLDFHLPQEPLCQLVHCTYWEWFYPKSASIRAFGNSSAVAAGIVTHSCPAEVGSGPWLCRRMQLTHKTRSGNTLEADTVCSASDSWGKYRCWLVHRPQLTAHQETANKLQIALNIKNDWRWKYKRKQEWYREDKAGLTTPSFSAALAFQSRMFISSEPLRMYLLSNDHFMQMTCCMRLVW